MGTLLTKLIYTAAACLVLFWLGMSASIGGPVTVTSNPLLAGKHQPDHVRDNPPDFIRRTASGNVQK